jgi:hypothetical protein
LELRKVHQFGAPQAAFWGIIHAAKVLLALRWRLR